MVAVFTATASRIDSLRQAIPTLKGEERCNAYIDLYLAFYTEGQIDSVLYYLDHVIDIRRQQDSLKKEAAARWTRVAILNNAGRFEQLEQEAIQQMEWFRKKEMWDRYYQVWQRKCSALHDQGKVQTSLREAHVMYNDATERGNDVGRAMAYKQMGMSFYDLHQYDEAISAFQHGIDLLVAMNEQSGLTSGLYDFLCKSYDKTKHYDKELAVTDVWLRYLNGILNMKGATLVYGPLCSAYVARASALVGLGRRHEALQAVKKAEENNQKNPTNLGYYYIYLVKATTSLHEGRYSDAVRWTDSIARLDERIDQEGEFIRAEAYIHLGRAAEAAKIYQHISAENDSIYSRDMRMQLGELNSLMRIDELKMQAKLERSQFIVERQRYIIVFAFIVVLLLLILFASRYHSIRQLKREHQLLLESNEKLECSYDELKKANARVEESSKLKNVFIQQVSHEIRTPLNVLSGFTQILTSNMRLDDATRHDINQRIIDNTNRITELVDKMLEMSEASTHTVINRTDTITVQQLISAAIGKSYIDKQSNITFHQELSPEARQLTLHTQENAAVRALVLLLHNARKYISNKHDPKASTHGQVWLKVTVDNSFVAFAVEDTGIGVPPDQAEHIFEEFVQLDNYYEGMGMGLTVARSMSRRLGGDIVLDTTYSPGARFVMTLPLD